MMNISQKLAVATVGAALTLAAIQAKPAAAAIISRSFTVSDFVGADKPGGPLSYGNFYTGSFSYDDALLTGFGLESIGISQLTFNFLGNTYTASDDINYPNYPKVRFLDGNIFDLDYSVSKPGIGDFSFSEKYIGTNSSGMSVKLSSSAEVPPYMAGKTYYGKVTYSSPISTSVPEPSTVVGFAVLGLGSLLLKKKRTSSVA